MSKVVVDTNVLLSGLRSKKGASYRLLQELPMGRFIVNLSVPLVMEYEKVLSDPKSGCPLSGGQVRDILDYICKVGSCHKIHYLWRPFLKDSKDDMVLEVAVASESKFIVTYNIKDFRGVERFNVIALTPLEFLKRKGIL